MARKWLIGVMVGTAVLAMPTAVVAAPRQGLDAAAGSVSGSRPQARQTPNICRPEPPEYPGCTAQQVRPLLEAAFSNEYTGHASGYQYYVMGQHHRGVIFAHLPAALEAKLARLYAEAVRQYAAVHTVMVVGEDGARHLVSSYPHYKTWAGFSAATTSFCNGGYATVHFPTQYCWSITKIGQAGAVINTLLNRTTKILFSCDGFAIGGWATGSYAAWRMGTGVLAGGYYGAVGVEIGCQTSNLWNWFANLW